jgi:hypothetical protein
MNSVGMLFGGAVHAPIRTSSTFPSLIPYKNNLRGKWIDS